MRVDLAVLRNARPLDAPCARTPVRARRRPAALTVRLLAWALALAAGTLLAWFAGAMLTGAAALAATPVASSGRERPAELAATDAHATTGAPRNPDPAATPRRSAAAAHATTGARARGAGSGSAPGSVWDKIAECESGGNWKISTGNGHHGGLQFTPSTWKVFGGEKYASTANKATKAQQIEIAEKVQAEQGWGAWPTCAKKAGAKGSSKKAKKDRSDESTKSARGDRYRSKSETKKDGHRKHRLERGGTKMNSAKKDGGSVTVVAGDTLSKIAEDNNIAGGWRALYESNKATLTDPNLIRPGQRLTLSR